MTDEATAQQPSRAVPDEGDALAHRIARRLPRPIRTALVPPQSAFYNAANRDAWVRHAASRLHAGSRVLDLGAGEGRYRRLFGHCEYKSQDFAAYAGTSDGLLADQWHYGAIDYVSDATEIPVASESFDAVLCTEVLEHVPEPAAVIREASRVLKPGGLLFLTAPLASGLHQEPYHFYGGFTPYFYERTFTQCGMTPLSIEQNGGLFLLVAQELVRAADVIDERRPYGWLNPLRWVVLLGLRILIPRWFATLDREVTVREFTAGYFVTARKEPLVAKG